MLRVSRRVWHADDRLAAQSRSRAHRRRQSSRDFPDQPRNPVTDSLTHHKLASQLFCPRATGSIAELSIYLTIRADRNAGSLYLDGQGQINHEAREARALAYKKYMAYENFRRRFFFIFFFFSLNYVTRHVQEGGTHRERRRLARCQTVID